MEHAAPEQVTLLPNDVIYVPMSGIGRADLWVRQHLRDIIPWELIQPPGIVAFFIVKKAPDRLLIIFWLES